MIYTQKIQKAIKFAAKTHNHYQQQTRKGKVIPYIAHPLTVGIILSLAGASEDVIAAGILHDTIEDSIEAKKVTPAMIEERFGKNVKDLVVSVTEMDKALPWAERKAMALEHIQYFSRDSVLLKSADILSNGTEVLNDYWSEVYAGRDGMEIFKRFKASTQDTIAKYERAIEALIKRWPENPLTGDLKQLDKEIQVMKKAQEDDKAKFEKKDELGDNESMKT